MILKESAHSFNQGHAEYFHKSKVGGSFFSHAPITNESFEKRLTELTGNNFLSAPREKLVDVLSAYHAPELLTPAVENNLDRLRNRESMVVIGGHQACLLTGPLYTIYKAITIILLARREEERLKRPVIPVFWIAGEDHDWEEVNHIWLLADKKGPYRNAFRCKQNRKEISRVQYSSEELHAWIEEVSNLLPDSMYKKSWMNTLKEITSSGASWTRFFARVMAHLFGDHGLVFVDSGDRILRKLESGFMEVLVRKNREIQFHVRKKHLEMKRKGYDSGVLIKEHAAHLFIIHNNHRYPLLFDGKQWTCEKLGKKWTTTDMLHYVRASPEKFSNNVITRPLMQEYLFPTLAFVGGPAEIKYWGLLRGVFKVCGLRMPVVSPRLHATLLDDKLLKSLDQFGISLEKLSDVKDVKNEKEKWINGQSPVDIDLLFRGVEREMTDMQDSLFSRIKSELNVNLVESGQIDHNKLVKHLAYLKRLTYRHIHEQLQKDIYRWNDILYSVFPLDKPQERVYNLLTYWNKYGIDWIEDLLNEIPPTRLSSSYVVIL